MVSIQGNTVSQLDLCIVSSVWAYVLEDLCVIGVHCMETNVECYDNVHHPCLTSINRYNVYFMYSLVCLLHHICVSIYL